MRHLIVVLKPTSQLLARESHGAFFLPRQVLPRESKRPGSLSPRCQGWPVNFWTRSMGLLINISKCVTTKNNYSQKTGPERLWLNWSYVLRYGSSSTKSITGDMCLYRNIHFHWEPILPTNTRQKKAPKPLEAYNSNFLNSVQFMLVPSNGLSHFQIVFAKYFDLAKCRIWIKTNTKTILRKYNENTCCVSWFF